MASSALLTLDTTAPAGVTLDIGTGVISARDLTAAIATSDPSTTGYQLKIYGDVDDAHDQANYRASEANAPWISFVTSKGIRLSAGDGLKTVRIKVRDGFGNASAETTDAVTLNTQIPTVSITAGPSPTTISKVGSFDTATLTVESPDAIDEIKVKVVAAASDPHTAGTVIPETAGSNTQASGAVTASTPIEITIKGADLESASAGDAAKRIKVFVRSSVNGLWSQGAS